MEAKIKLYVVDDEESVIHRIQEILTVASDLGITLIGYANTYSYCKNDIERCKRADVMLISAQLPDRKGIEIPQMIKEVSPKMKFIVTVDPDTRNQADLARKLGANEILQKPFSASDLIKIIFGVVGVKEEKNTPKSTAAEPFVPTLPNASSTPVSAEKPKKNTTPVSIPEDTRAYDLYSSIRNIHPASQKETEIEKPKGLITFYSTSGQDKSAILANIAVSIAKFSEYKPRICIVDLNLLYPSVFHKFNEDDLISSKEKNIYDLLEDLNDINDKLVEQALITHEPTGIKILNTPDDRIWNSRFVNSKTIKYLISYLRNMFDLILIDTSPNIKSDETMIPLMESTKSIIFIEPTVSSLVHTKNFIDSMNFMERSMPEKITSRFDYVLINHDDGAGVDAELAQEAIYNYPIRSRIPNDVKMKYYSNNGRFVVETNSQTGKILTDLASYVYPFEKEISFNHKSKSSRSNPFSNLFSFGKKK